MKMRILSRLSLIAAGTALVFACNKSNNNSSTGGSTTDANVQTAADDESQVSNESEAVNNDANTALYSQSAIAGTSASSAQSGSTTTMDVKTVEGNPVPITGLICDATVTVNIDSVVRTITITYNGLNCNGNRTRTGVVVITIPAGVHWKDKGAVVTVDIENLKITRLSDNKSITLNGTRTFTNVSGGLLTDLATLGSITHTVTADSLQITFNNGSTRIWSIAKQRLFTYDNGIVVTTTGTYSDGTYTNIAEWGTNRFGNSFVSTISQPKIIRQDCDFRLVSGQNTVYCNGNTTTVTYGLDANGDPTSCPGTGYYYYKAVWVGANGKTITKILPY